METFARLCIRNSRATGLFTKLQYRNYATSNLTTQSVLSIKDITTVKSSFFGSLPHFRPISTSEHAKLSSSKSANTEEEKHDINKETLTHFHEHKKLHQQKIQSSEKNISGGLGVAPVDKDVVHPDVEEALGMHEGGYRLPHPVWNSEELESVRITHRVPVTRTDKIAYFTVSNVRKLFDFFSGYTLAKYRGRIHERQWLKRIIFLETIAGVPGMVGAMVRHLGSLRTMKRDHGWIHTLLEEAENERMHLMTALRVANPGIIMKIFIACGQGIFVSFFSLAYMISPTFCHRFVGYLEEEAVITYTDCIKAIDNGELKMWCRMKAPEIAVEYWKLGDNAMMRDVILAIRADEAHHRTVNHTLGSKKQDEKNPYKPGE